MAMKAKIIGYGVSGKAAESFLESRGIETVVVADAAEQVDGEFDFCVVSPGVPAAAVADEKIPVVPEVELPFYLDPTIKPKCLVAVTGTNGKTTIVNQINKMCLDDGKNAVLCGNVGIPVSRVADKLSGAIAVVEVSSFMLEQTKVLHPQIAVLTNITSDHLDRHQTMAEYIRCKQQIVAQQSSKDVLVVNWDDKNAREVGLAVQKSGKPKVIWYSTSCKVKGYYLSNGGIYESKLCGSKRLCAVDDLGGMPHTLANSLAVMAVGRRLGISLSAIVEACKYREQQHRIELVADNNGVAFYNDSKATNIAATLAATRSFTLPICLLVCGQTKGQDYQELLLNLPSHVTSIIVFGACKDEVLAKAAALGVKKVYPVADLNAALKKAIALCVRPGVVLFSPAGSSFDQFKNYQDRGEKFRTLVNELIRQETQC